MNLNQLIAKQFYADPERDPSKMGTAIFAEISKADHAYYAEMYIRQAIRAFLSDQRGRNFTAETEILEKPWVDDANDVNLLPKPRVKSSHSSFVQGVRDAASQWLASGFHVGGEWKIRGELTAEDLQWCIDEREGIAARNHSEADVLRRQLKALEQHGVATIAALPESVIEELMAR